MTEIHEKAPEGAVLVPRGEALNLYIITGLRLLGNRLGDGVIHLRIRSALGCVPLSGWYKRYAVD